MNKKTKNRCRRTSTFGYWNHVLVAGCIFVATITNVVSGFAQDIPVHGESYASLEGPLDQMARDLVKDNKLPGLSLAVTKNGKLIYAKGFGYRDLINEKVMRDDSRINIGSCSKAVVTGPCTWELLKAHGMNYKTKTLYGSNGIFKETFAGQIDTGVKRFNPIVAMAIGEHVATYYANGTRSLGSSADLDKYQEPVAYKLPAGKTPADIRGMGVGKSGKTYTWYDDGTVSSGDSITLDKYSKPDPDSKLKLPSGKSMKHIVGIGINKSNSRCNYFFEDGTWCSGDTMDSQKYSKPKPFDYVSVSGGTRYNIRGMGVNSADRVYTWFGNGYVTAGTTSNLSHHKLHYLYSFPNSVETGPDWKQWYSQITLRHVFDHTAGFDGSGDTHHAEIWRGASGLPYEDAHKHFLMTRKLLAKPGTEYSYSNHGFGMLTMVVEKLAGKSYRDYAIDDYLAPMGLKGDVRPESITPDARDACKYKFDKDGKPVLIPFKDSLNGLAAGGWRSSAKDIARIMAMLDQKYNYNEIDAMGWGKSVTALAHSGETGSGSAYTLMFTDDSTNEQVRGIHVVLLANVGDVSGMLRDESKKFAVEVSNHDIPSSFDLWEYSLAGGGHSSTGDMAGQKPNSHSAQRDDGPTSGAQRKTPVDRIKKRKRK